jgi:arylformamidase
LKRVLSRFISRDSNQAILTDQTKELKVIDWRTLNAAELERAYSPSSAIGGNYQPYIDLYVQRSAAARAWFATQSVAKARYDLSYGSAFSQLFDLFLPQSSSAPPLVVFIHGGYWQALSKNESHFCAVHAVQAGLAHAVLDYTLAPAISVSGIVDECVHALCHLHTQAAALGFDPNRIIVTGSSAGAHLAAMVALRCSAVRATILVSGIYELEPLMHTTINDALSMQASETSSVSPGRLDLRLFPACLLAYGEIETQQFKQQSDVFARLLGQKNAIEISQRNHFDVILDLLDPASDLGAASLAFIQQL